MCGIIGAYAFDGFEKKSEEKYRTEASIFITTQLLQMTVDRGKDATGVSMLWADGNYTGLKMGIPSPSFIARFGDKETEFKGMLKMWREYPKVCRIFMGHCRKASKGNSYDNKNNHPLQVGDMVFVHNGTLNNDDVIFEKLKAKRSADVDSEAIGHLLKHYTHNGKEPFVKEVMDEVTRRLNGTYSVIAANGNNPFQVAQFRDGRPAEFVFVKPLKTVYVASEKKFLENILFEYNKFTQLFSNMDLPYLKEKDVEFKTMTDDAYVIWDLTTPIQEDTTIDDLYDWGKTPLRADKVWKGTTTTTTYNAYQGNTYNASKKTVVASSTDTNKTNSAKGKTTTSDTQGTDTTSDGVVWSKGLNKYKTSEGIEKTKKCGAVEIDIDTQSISYLAPEDGDDEPALTEVDKNRVENILASASKISEVAIDRTEDAVDEVKKPGTSASNNSGNDSDDVTSTLVEIDMTTDSPAAAKAANDHCKTLPKFVDDDAVVEALELDDPAVLKALPLHALANRIVKFVFKKGFAVGFDKAFGSMGPFSKENDKHATKLQRAEEKIRMMKMMLGIMGSSLQEEFKNTRATDADIADSFMDSIANMIKSEALNRLRPEEVLSVGDLKNIPLLSDLKSTIEKERDH